jgi:hypothetical protein
VRVAAMAMVADGGGRGEADRIVGGDEMVGADRERGKGVRGRAIEIGSLIWHPDPGSNYESRLNPTR